MDMKTIESRRHLDQLIKTHKEMEHEEHDSGWEDWDWLLKLAEEGQQAREKRNAVLR